MLNAMLAQAFRVQTRAFIIENLLGQLTESRGTNEDKL
jgi:hypothetical protein